MKPESERDFITCGLPVSCRWVESWEPGKTELSVRALVEEAKGPRSRRRNAGSRSFASMSIRVYFRQACKIFMSRKRRAGRGSVSEPGGPAPARGSPSASPAAVNGACVDAEMGSATWRAGPPSPGQQRGSWHAPLSVVSRRDAARRSMRQRRAGRGPGLARISSRSIAPDSSRASSLREQPARVHDCVATRSGNRPAMRPMSSRYG